MRKSLWNTFWCCFLVLVIAMSFSVSLLAFAGADEATTVVEVATKAPWWAPLLATAIAAISGWLVTLAERGLGSWKASNTEKAKTSRTHRYLARIDDVVADAILATLAVMAPAIAEALKDGKITTEERDDLMQKAMAAIKASLGDSWDDIKERFHLSENGMVKYIEKKVLAKLFVFTDGAALDSGN